MDDCYVTFNMCCHSCVLLSQLPLIVPLIERNRVSKDLRENRVLTRKFTLSVILVVFILHFALSV